jgi:hypothetical protein
MTPESGAFSITRAARDGSLAAHIFAMKALAARTRDIDDLRLLAGIAGVESADDALQICADFNSDEPISARSAAVLRELFG